MNSGAFRQVPPGTPGAEWAEGVGYHVFDEQAQRETSAAANQIARLQWGEARSKALSDLRQADARLAQLLRERAAEHRDAGWETMREGNPALLERSADAMDGLRRDVTDFFMALDKGWLGQMPEGFNDSAFVKALRAITENG